MTTFQTPAAASARVSSFATLFGPFTIAVDANGALRATAFGDRARMNEFFDLTDAIEDEHATARAREQITAFLAGDRRAFDLPLAPRGSEFQQRVWRALLAIPRGETRSYGELARALGSSARAVGRANATNPICLVVPCHRVIGADGSLTGFAYGEPLKRRLLELEGALLPLST
jgi:methylated-DNA-[protein]-cysteine S-methyltransferase